jgi:predicted HTH transcriptional regulator
MTNREFLIAVSALENAPAEIVEHATAAIAKLDATNEARKNKPSKAQLAKQAENAALAEEILAVLTTEAVTEGTVAEAVGVTGPKARAVLKMLVEADRVVKGEAKVPKKGTCKVYSLPEANTDAE